MINTNEFDLSYVSLNLPRFWRLRLGGKSAREIQTDIG